MGSVIESELVACGAGHVNLDKFLGALRTTRQLHFPGWSPEDFGTRPRKALLFCDLIRHDLGGAIPDELILRHLFHLIRIEDPKPGKPVSDDDRPTKVEIPKP